MENQSHTPAQRPLAATDAARFDDIEQTLFNLTAIVKLAAFAAEARRTLVEIEDVLHVRPDIDQVIHQAVFSASQWSMLEDSSGEVLTCVARQLERVSGEVSQTFQGLATARPAPSKPKKTGGAA